MFSKDKILQLMCEKGTPMSVEVLIIIAKSCFDADEREVRSWLQDLIVNEKIIMLDTGELLVCSEVRSEVLAKNKESDTSSFFTAL